MKKTRIVLSASVLLLVIALPAFAADKAITSQQKNSAEQFIKALMKNDYRAAYEQFSPAVRGRYPFPIFSDIQNNITKTIGVPVSYKLKKPASSEKKAASSCVYDMTYAKEGKKTAIPLELNFLSADPDGKLASFTYIKEQMSPPAP